MRCLQTKQGLINSLLRVLTMFQLCLIDGGDKVEATDIRCIHYKKEIGLYLWNSTLENNY